MLEYGRIPERNRIMNQNINLSRKVDYKHQQKDERHQSRRFFPPDILL
jgi:hypothetical protein